MDPEDVTIPLALSFHHLFRSLSFSVTFLIFDALSPGYSCERLAKNIVPSPCFFLSLLHRWNTVSKSNPVGKGLIWCYSLWSIVVCCPLSGYRNSGRARTRTRTWSWGERGGCCLLACSLWLAQPALLQDPGPPSQGWPHIWAFPSQPSIKRKPHLLHKPI